MLNKIDPNKERIYLLSVNEAWYNGNPTVIEGFYKQREDALNPYKNIYYASNHSFFWKKVTAKFHKTHSGLPRLITNRMRDLVNTGFNVSSVEEKQADRVEILEEILKDNSFNNLFDNGITTESWAGYTAYKISIDKEVSKYPILETVRPEQIEVIKTRGRIVGYIVNFTITIGKDTVYIAEEFRVIKDVLHISYSAFVDVKKTKKYTKEIPFENTTVPGIDFLPVFLKNNTTDTFDGTYGVSDYTGSIPLFDDLDETLSQRSQRIRHSGPKRFISEDLLKTRADGSTTELNDFEIDYTLTSEQLGEAKPVFENIESKPQTEDYINTKNDLIGQILGNSGMSPLTIGDMASAGLNNDGDTLRERERLSLRTRDSKLKLWAPFLADLFNKLLKTNDVMNSKTTIETELMVVFDEYTEISKTELITTLTEARMAGLVSVRQSVELLNPELNKEEVDRLVIQIKQEQVIPLAQGDVQSEEVLKEIEEAATAATPIE